MMTREDIQKIVNEQLVAKLKGDKGIAAQPTTELPVPPKPPEPPQPIVKKLDEVDAVMLENLVLKQELEKKQIEIENMRRSNVDKALKEAQMDLQNYLVDKYEVDATKSTLVINGQSRTLTITPRG
jgi:hypothetical protein